MNIMHRQLLIRNLHNCEFVVSVTFFSDSPLGVARSGYGFIGSAVSTAQHQTKTYE